MKTQNILRVADYLRQPNVDKYDLTVWNALNVFLGEEETFCGNASDLNSSFLYAADLLRRDELANESKRNNERKRNFYYFNMGFIGGTGWGLDTLAEEVIQKWDEEADE
ncbi:MAG: hypothetical protein CBD86_03290 [Gammaproteobacteria bacterium TMED226]|nr:MAG: hypothetical protein CBD86_03290 [Gammaproteobacteria bacterium TMED226]|tara:strand:- start:2844 stop:3170 length:327 start_codon:yes stop_codon:yes gene_type:complete